ncbi:hypothetical protein BH11PSE9_BH11PSE9_29470 [soil metagenome]
MKKTLAFALTVVLGTAASYPLQASAATYAFTLDGGGISGSIELTYGAATDARYGQAFEITGISGTFSDANIGISNASILGLVAINHATPEVDNMLAPHGFSRFAVATGTSPVSGGFLTYDNLFWPGGSPATASDYPAAGGFLDIYGVMYRIGNGRVVDLWSNGIFGPPGSEPIQYGVGVATVDAMLDYVPAGVSAVPEPATLALMLGGLGVLGWAARRQAAR